MKYGFKEIRISMGLFDFDVLCIIGDYKNAGKYIGWKYEEEDFDLVKFDRGYECWGKTFYKTGYIPVLWIPRKPQTSREHATLAHEALHCVFHLFEWAGIPISRDTEEVATHSTGHIVNEILSSKI